MDHPDQRRFMSVPNSNNCYRCCETVEEGTQALNAFMARQVSVSPSTPATQNGPRPMDIEQYPALPIPADDSWWCCFAGAEPGVYQGL